MELEKAKEWVDNSFSEGLMELSDGDKHESIMALVNRIYDKKVNPLEAQLKALQDKELTFCEVETAKLKAELATYKDNVVYEVNGILDNYYIEADDGISMKAPYSVYKNFEENSMFKVIILKEQK